MMTENSGRVIWIVVWWWCTDVCMAARPRLQAVCVSLSLSTDSWPLAPDSRIQSLRLEFSTDALSRLLCWWHRPATRGSRNSTCSDALTHTHTHTGSGVSVNVCVSVLMCVCAVAPADVNERWRVALPQTLPAGLLQTDPRRGRPACGLTVNEAERDALHRAWGKYIRLCCDINKAKRSHNYGIKKMKLWHSKSLI